MLRILLLALGLAVLVSGSASAAPFGELPFRSVSGTATCLRATGAPGELVRSTSTGAEILQAGPAGLTAVVELPAGGDTFDCPEAVAQPSGAGIVAFSARDSIEAETLVQARLREPGGAWGQVTEVMRTQDRERSNGRGRRLRAR